MQKIEKAFTLLELIIVIVIIGAVYLLFFSKFETAEKRALRDFALLKEYLVSKYGKAEIKLICSGEKCEKCFVYSENEKKDIGFSLFTSKPKIFEYDKFGYLYEKKYPSDVCFEYKIYKNGSSSDMFVEKEGKYYIFYSFLKETEVFYDYDEAKRQFEPANFLPISTDKYYYGAK